MELTWVAFWIVVLLGIGFVVGWTLRGFDVTKVVFYDGARVNGDLLPDDKRVRFIEVKANGTPAATCFHEVNF